VLDKFGLFRDEGNVAELSELGVLFLLFEQGLELSFDRLKALAKYAFGLGLVQVLLSTAVFTAFELPVGNAVGTQILTRFLGAAPELVDIRSVDEAIVIGAGLSLSSSAFVLQLLSERGELATPFGRATLGILLLQDIAVVPLLVVLPLYEASASAGDVGTASILATLGPTAIKALAGLGALLLGGRVVLRRVFEVVAGARSTEAFVALCLLTVTGTSLLTQRLGFSDTLGAFLAGVLLAETNYRSQVEADIRPFRGLLLGLFFVTTGTSIDTELLAREWPNVLGLLAGLIAVKTTIVTAAGPLVGLSRAESVRTGLLVGQGGEFAFVVFSLANQLGVLPLELNKLLIIVVVASMALTPALAEAGAIAYNIVDKWERGEGADVATALPGGGEGAAGGDGEGESKGGELVVCGFGPQGQTVANLLRARQERPGTPRGEEGGEGGVDAACGYVAFDLDPRRVQGARRRGYNVLYGDASRPAVLAAAGIKRPSAVAVAYARPERSLAAVTSLRAAYGAALPILARARDPAHGAELRAAGATVVVVDSLETGLLLGSAMLSQVGEPPERTQSLAAAVRAALDASAGKAMSSLAEPQRDAIERANELEQVAALSIASAAASALPSVPSDSDGATSCLLPQPEAAAADKR
jgi:Kef-type K+ transport system membrane component KefB/voltage-gated potassium channel Kch